MLKWIPPLLALVLILLLHPLPAAAATIEQPVGLAHAAPTKAFEIESVVSQTQKERWLLEAIATRDRALAWQIAGQHFIVQYDHQEFVAHGLNVDLAYRGQDGLPLMQALKERVKFYRKHPAVLHRDLSDPNRIVHRLRPPATSDVLTPGSVTSYELVAQGDVTYQLIGGKLYHEQMGMRDGVPQDLLVYDAAATAAYAHSPLAFQSIGRFNVQ